MRLEAVGTGLPGCSRAPQGPAADRVLLRVRARQSDAVLRRVLAWDGVHVAGVRADRGARG